MMLGAPEGPLGQRKRHYRTRKGHTVGPRVLEYPQVLPLLQAGGTELVQDTGHQFVAARGMHQQGAGQESFVRGRFQASLPSRAQQSVVALQVLQAGEGCFEIKVQAGWVFCEVSRETLRLIRKSPLTKIQPGRGSDFREAETFVVVHILHFGFKDLVAAEIKCVHKLRARSSMTGLAGTEVSEELLVPERRPEAWIVMIALCGRVHHNCYFPRPEFRLALNIPQRSLSADSSLPPDLSDATE